MSSYRSWISLVLCVSCAASASSRALAQPPAGDPPAADPCPYRVNTPPAVDQSEVPRAGDPPAPIPVPATPLGGELMASCGIVAAPDMPPLPGDVSADAWILADLDSGDIIAAKDPQRARKRMSELIQLALQDTPAVNAPRKLKKTDSR